MILVTITQESRRLALADMLNASFLGADLVEIRLDLFEKDAPLGDITAAKRTPVLFSCKRRSDGGQWAGTEDERLTLLRTAVVAKADYVDVELDAADQIRPFPGCKRVVSYTNTDGVPSNVADVYKEMLSKKPDVIRLTCKAETPEAAWPLVQLLNKPPVPTVVTGLGRPGRLFALLGQKTGAPWVEAALERGSEAYEGQATIRELTDGYRFRDVGKTTRFVGVTGADERAFLLAVLVNAGFAAAGTPHRVLPVQVGGLKTFRKVADAVRLQGVLAEPGLWERVHEVAAHDESARPPVGAADFMAPAGGGWAGSNLYGPAVARALADAVADRWGTAEPLKGRVALFAGGGVETRLVAPALRAAGMSVVFAERTKDEGHALSQAFGGRHVLREAVYSTHHDVLILPGGGGLDLHPGYLKPAMAVLDLSAAPRPGPFAAEAVARGALAVDPVEVLVGLARECVRRVGGGEVPAGGVGALRAALGGWLPE